LEPKRRDLDLEDIKEQVNRSEEVKIRDLREVPRDKIETLKEWQPDKTYRATVKFEEGVPEDLEKLKELEGTVEQRTPSRVEHRRSDRIRKRKVKSVEWEKKNENTIELEVRAEAGTYIKELISGDSGRTEPSVTSLFGNEAECTELDVVKIHDRDRLDL
ncbi:MAG: tRNA pseudouridine(54/55) synthase Pus10, partial [Candidatus Aenigmatarchaeota archaeon]